MLVPAQIQMGLPRQLLLPPVQLRPTLLRVPGKELLLPTMRLPPLARQGGREERVTKEVAANV
jgi:hypothetical protein